MGTITVAIFILLVSPVLSNGDAQEETTKAPFSVQDYETAYINTHAKIFESYKKGVRPHIDRPLTINFTMVITHVDKVDENLQTINLNGWTIMQWDDPRLAWKTTEFQFFMKTLLPQDDIWTPDIHLYNNAEAKVVSLIGGKTWAQVYSDGRVIIDPPMGVRAYCEFDYNHYPYDSQSCTLILGSWSYRTEELKWRLTKDTAEDSIIISTSHRDQNTNWRITNVTTLIEDVPFEGEKWNYININIHLKRLPSFAGQFTLFPVGLFLFLTTFAFLLVARFGKWKLAVLLGTLSLEVMHFLLLHVVLPEAIFNGKPLIMSLCKINIIMTTVAFFLAALTSSLAERDEAEEPAGWLQEYLLPFLDNIIFRMICFLPRYERSKQANGVYRGAARDQKRRQQEKQKHSILVTNQLSPARRFHYIEDPELSALGGGASTEETVRPAQRNPCGGGSRMRRYGIYWRISVILDRLLFLIFAIVYAVLWNKYVG